MTRTRAWNLVGGTLSGVILAAGLGLVIAFVGGIIVSLFQPDWHGRHLVFTEQGEPRIQEQAYDEAGQHYRWLDLDGEVVGSYTDYRDLPSLSMAHLWLGFPYPHSGWPTRFVATLQDYSGWDIRRYRAFWYFLAHEGVIAGYAHPSGAHLGTFGPEGRLESASGMHFESPVQSYDTRYRPGTIQGYAFDHVFADGDSLIGFTLNPPRMSRFWQSGGERIERLGLVSNWGDKNKSYQVMVEDGGRLTVLDREATVLGIVQLPAPLRDPERHYTAGWTGERVVVSCPWSADRTLAYALSPTGETLHEWDVRLREPEPLVWWKSRTYLPVTLCTSPWTGIVTLIVDRYWPEGEPSLTLALYWPLLAVSAAITLAAILLTRRYLAHRSRRTTMIWWTVVAAVLSWPGFLLCITMMPLPRRVACPACGRLRSPETDTCPRCSADWPLPERTGLEILLPAGA